MKTQPAQLALFDGSDLLTRPMPVEPKTLVHKNDPVTSYEAAERGESSGSFGRQRDAVLAALREHGPATAVELAHKSGIDRFVASRRLPELESRFCVVERLPARVCRVSGSRQTEWRAVEVGR